MGITIDFSRMTPAIGLQAVASFTNKVRALHARLAERRAAGALPFYDLPAQDTGELKACARRLEGRFANLVVLGSGASALGLIALNSALRTPYRWAEKEPRLYVLDNIDPERVRTLLEALDPRQTLVNMITKSGDTAETIAKAPCAGSPTRTAWPASRFPTGWAAASRC